MGRITPAMDEMRERDCTVSWWLGNFLGLIFIIPVCTPFIVLYTWLWGSDRLLSSSGLPTILFFFVIGVILHEFIHGITWAFFSGKPLRSFKFGIKFKILTPYAHATEDLPIQAYRIGIVMPGLVLGVVPCIAAILCGSSNLMLVGILMTAAAGGDIVMLWVLRHAGSHSLVRDHPDRLGCILIEPMTQ